MKTQGLGRTLRVERERRSVSLDAIARATMVRRDYLELIDEDLLDRLPPGAYAKGFIRAYAQYLGLDPHPYVKAYENHCAQPAPELSAVVRHPVRVPNAAGPRGWRIAAAAAVSLLVLLGLVGAFRSGSEPEPTEVPAVNAAAIEDLSSTGPNPLGAVVRVKATRGASWMQAITEDGEVLFEGVLSRGQEEMFRSDELIELVLGNPTAVKVIANGQDVGSPTGEGSYRAFFTPETMELPEHVPADTDS